MKIPQRMSDPRSGASPEIQSGLRSLAKPRAMTEIERQLTSVAVKKIAAGTVAGAGSAALLKSGGWLAGALVVAAVATGALVRSAGPSHAPPTSPPGAAILRPVVLPTRPSRALEAVTQATAAPTAQPSPLAPVQWPAPTRAAQPRARSAHAALPVSQTPVAESPGPASAESAVALAAPTIAVGSATQGFGGRATSPNGEDPIETEAHALGEAMQLIARDPARALALLAAFDLAHPSAQLRAEREFLGFEALRALGRTDDAQLQGQRLIQRHPSSIQASRTRRLLQQMTGEVASQPSANSTPSAPATTPNP
ncbi:MAG: hypothetical protein Q8Q09_23710 [Deltaproteobacteria bacterium]|nr:hypothetical protein [Deltaproteobacteria bacterium]